MNKDSTKYATIFACALIVLVGSITITAILRYDVEDALRVWSGMETLVAAVVGAAATYFFSRRTLGAERRRGDVLEALAKKNGLI